MTINYYSVASNSAHDRAYPVHHLVRVLLTGHVTPLLLPLHQMQTKRDARN